MLENNTKGRQNSVDLSYFSMSSNIDIFHILATVFGNELLTCGEVVAKQSVKHDLGGGGIGGGNRDETSCLGVHGGHPHHVGIVFAKTLGALQGVTLMSNLFENLCLFELVKSKEFLILGGDFEQGSLCDKHLMLCKKRGEQTVEEREEQRANLETVLVGIGTNNDL